MANSREKEGSQLRLGLSQFMPLHELLVNMLQQKQMHGSIPFPVVVHEADAIPPVFVKFTVRESCDFGEQVANCLKENLKECEVEECHWENQ